MPVAARRLVARARARGLAAGVLAATAAAGLVLAPGATARPGACRDAHATVDQAGRDALDRAVVCLVNQQRQARHLPALTADPRLNRSAQGWTDEMVKHGDFSHGAAFMNRITAVGFDWSNVGENIATGYESPTAVVAGWMASRGHCENILSPVYRQVGTGVSNHSVAGASTIDGTWTQDFGLIMGQRPASGDYGPAEGCPYR